MRRKTGKRREDRQENKSEKRRKTKKRKALYVIDKRLKPEEITENLEQIQ